MSKNEKKKAGKGKYDTAIIVALIGLIGTLVVGILNSPLILKLLERTPETPSSTEVNGQLIFNEDFEDGSADGFAFDMGKWDVLTEGSNHLLRATATEPETPAAKAYFGSNDFSSGIVEFRIKFLQMKGFYMDFRFHEGVGTYVLYFSPEYQSTALATNILEGNDWQFNPITTDSTRPFTFKKDSWIRVQMKLQDKTFILNIDGNRILSASDARFSQGGLRFTLDPTGEVALDDIKVWTVNP